MLVELAGQSARDSDNEAANPSRLINCHREKVMQGGRTGYAIKNVLGQSETDNTTAAIRAMGRADAKNWCVSNGTLYEISSTGTVTSRGTVADDANTTISGNYTDVTVVAGNNYYIYDGAVSQPTTKAFTNVGSHCYVGGYTVITEADGRKFQWSGLGDASTLDALHFASADKVDDDILRVVEFRGALLVLCETSSELWQITGAAETAFSFVQSNNLGLKAFNLMARFDDALFLVGNDNRAYIWGQGVVSTPAVETAIAQDTPTHCFYYEDEGHKFCVIRFSDRPAWVFDMTELEWHERAEGAGNGPFRATASVRDGGTWRVGNTVGSIMEMARTAQDINGDLYRTVVGHPVFTGDAFTIDRLEILARVGDHELNTAIDYGLDTGDGFILDAGGGFGLDAGSEDATERNAMIDLYESGDGGRTWRGPYERSLGKMAEYDTRVSWRARGHFQQYSPKLVCHERADITLYAHAVVEAE